jgi:2,3-dihydroxybenzoate-AMP ligase
MALEGFTNYKKDDMAKYNKYRFWLGCTWGDLLDKATDLYPTKVALVDDVNQLTFATLREKVDKLAIGLMDLGIRKGQRVLLQIPNWNEFVYSFYAIQKIGAIAVLLLPRHNETEISFLAELTKPVAWIVPMIYRRIEYLPIVSKILKTNRQIKYLISVRSEASKGFDNLEEIISKTELNQTNLRKLACRRPKPTDVAQIMPTGGTTGLPKAAPRTHNDFICNVEYHSRGWEITSDDTIMTIAPISHGQGMLCGVGGSIFNFAKYVIIDSTEPADICKVIEREKVTAIPTVPALLTRLINYSDLKKYDISSLRKVYAGGAPSTPELVLGVHEKLKCKFVNAFGSVEGSISTTRLDDNIEKICGTVGKKSCPYDTFKIIDRNENELGPNIEGELVTKGPGIFTGYLGLPESNQAIFTRDGFLKTGDLARIDEFGYITITGRIKDIILRGGENIIAFDIENLIGSHPDVENVAVVGMPDKELGERICAYIQCKAGKNLRFDQVITFLKNRGASVFQLPERIEFIDHMPLTKVGKTDKKALREHIKKLIECNG